MPRKTEGTTNSRKKKTVPTEAPAVQALPERQVSPEVRSIEVRDNVTPINVAPIKPAAIKTQAGPASPDVNLDEEVRRRAYELFVERKGVAGDPTADWFLAEREVRARHAGKGSAFAASQRG